MTKLVKDASTGEEFDDIWEALGITPEEAANVEAAADLMEKIQTILKGNEWTEAQGAIRCGIPQSRMRHLMHGHTSQFSLEAILSIATTLGRKVRIEIEAA
jgi:predicted XRE-type DNA-binding protein